GPELERDALVRLYADDKLVMAEFFGVGSAERQMRSLLEDDRDLSHAAGEALPRPQVEGDTGPTTCLDTQPNCRERLGFRVSRNAFLSAVGKCPLAREPALVVLAAHCVGGVVWRQ